MAAGKVASIQAPFDRRIKTLPMPSQSVKRQIQRGYMVQEKNLPGYKTNRSGKFVLNYLYNPSTVEAMYTVQTNSAALAYLFPNAGDIGDLAVPLSQTASWTIMFDRTYELNLGSYTPDGRLVRGHTSIPAPNGISADPTVYGVWADIVQLQFFTGMMLQGGSAANADKVIQNVAKGGQSFKASQGFMMMVPCWVFFGGQSNINYYGYISEWDVTYTHFTQFMVPMRCVVDITFNMLPPPAAKGTGGGSGGFYPTPTGQAPPGHIPIPTARF